ncbi:BAG family molecular chaperone regulator 5, mitochondrial-like [Malania oleifera]|uniref:BAG family molecular chaperone regulator 5, mitochondrial-like n=1 Tax=Malania oleifera TaxID=397392 RepID=UPI0025AE5537|nr:BAG family molecular chaperone regulator 5, mitochondrial-like [Malania oleifera]
MRPSGGAPFFSSSSTTSTCGCQNDPTTHRPDPRITEIPTESSMKQSTNRSHAVCALVMEVTAVESEAARLERLLHRQETVDALLGDDREKLRMNESLMALLLRLDTVPGVDPAVREMRRSVSRRIVGLQEIVDAICDAKGFHWNGILSERGRDVAHSEDCACKGRFRAGNLGFR